MIGTLDALLAGARHSAGMVLEATAKRGDECTPNIVAIRAGEVRVVCSLEVSSIELALITADIVAKGFDPEMIAVTVDAYTSALLVNPTTDHAWRVHEMDELGALGVAMGWTSETLIVHAINRAGDIGTLHANYRRHGTRIEWTDTATGDTSGAFCEKLVESMLAPTVTQRSGRRMRKRLLSSRDELDVWLVQRIRRKLPVLVDLLP